VAGGCWKTTTTKNDLKNREVVGFSRTSFYPGVENVYTKTKHSNWIGEFVPGWLISYPVKTKKFYDLPQAQAC
jgi:hypothetical protein